MVAGVPDGVAGGVGSVGCGELTAGDDAVGDGVIAAGVVLDAQATTNRVPTMVAAALAVADGIGAPSDPAAYASMIVVVQSTVLSGAIARMLAEDPLLGSGSIARA